MVVVYPSIFGVIAQKFFRLKEKKLNIVVAEDQVLACQSLARLLGIYPFTNQVYTAYNGMEAVHVIENYHIDLALLDVRCP